ncbi:MAG: carboxymuconolactone decarboxylase [Alphaproteobacteria bacterium PA2]|nr:MAG: carboxymuconolactone decarboxylase [Alphaproteobacteria bacterium PA2]
MPRLAPLEPPYSPELQANFDQIMSKGVPPLVLFRTVGRSARAWRKFREGSLLDGRLISLREREILIDRTCALAGCEYEWGVHIAAFAKAAGLTPNEIAATCTSDGACETWSEAEGALIATANALHANARLSDAEFAALRAWYDEAQVLEIIMLCGFYRTVAYLANGLDLPLEPTAARFEVVVG